jgi:hypothetical protein
MADAACQTRFRCLSLERPPKIIAPIATTAGNATRKPVAVFEKPIPNTISGSQSWTPMLPQIVPNKAAPSAKTRGSRRASQSS